MPIAATKTRHGSGPIAVRGARGLTILELLIVVAILAAVAFVSTSALDNVYEDSHTKLARAEMMRVAQAIRQFKEDTGYYPKEGLFERAQVTIEMPHSGTTAEEEAWFASPANLDQLINQPLDTAGSNLLPWNAAIGRGWRGPYLQRELFVDIGDNLVSDGSGDPLVVDTRQLKNIPAIGDPFEVSPISIASGTDRCVETIDNTDCILDWRIIFNNEDGTEEDGESSLGSYGSPYLYFIDDAATSNITGCEAVPCLVSMGPNGFYEYGDGDDLVVNLR